MIKEDNTIHLGGCEVDCAKCKALCGCDKCELAEQLNEAVYADEFDADYLMNLIGDGDLAEYL